MKIYAVIPAYNEEKTVAEVVEKTKDLDLVDEVIVVDDCSTDNTFQEAKKAGARAVRLIINMGAGFSTRIGCDIAVNDGADVIVTLDADGQHDPAEIPKLVQVLGDKGLDIVFGSRPPNSEMPFIKRVGNTGLYWIAYLLYKMRIKDTQTGYHVFTKNAYEKIRWESNRYGVVSEIPVRVAKNRLRHEEVIIKTIYTDKVRGISVLDGLKSGWMMLLWRFQR